jgi:hypothetical protein
MSHVSIVETTLCHYCDKPRHSVAYRFSRAGNHRHAVNLCDEHLRKHMKDFPFVVMLKEDLP